MAGLIDDVMDFARARLGGGFEVYQRPDLALGAVILETVDELRLAHPGRTIVTEIDIPQPVVFDARRLAQLLSNLLGNAVAHGAEHSPITVRAGLGADSFQLTVTNLGQSIPVETQARLFEPFSRAEYGPGKQGLGLGLYIASEIARAHGGTLDVVSEAGETRFVFRMPLA